MSMLRTPKCDSASTTAFQTAGVAPIAPASPMPFAPSGLRGVGVSRALGLEVRQVAGARDRVGRERAGHVVAVLVEGDLLEQRLRDALGDAAVDLALDQHRVRDAPRVVDRDVTDQVRQPGLGVDLDDREVGAERVRRVRRGEVVLGRQAAFEALGQRATGRPRPSPAPPTGSPTPASPRRRGPRPGRPRCRPRRPRAGARRAAGPSRAPRRSRSGPRCRRSAASASPPCPCRARPCAVSDWITFTSASRTPSVPTTSCA